MYLSEKGYGILRWISNIISTSIFTSFPLSAIIPIRIKCKSRISGDVNSYMEEALHHYHILSTIHPRKKMHSNWTLFYPFRHIGSTVA